jgi:hypothetical protein
MERRRAVMAITFVRISAAIRWASFCPARLAYFEEHLPEILNGASRNRLPNPARVQNSYGEKGRRENQLYQRVNIAPERSV